MTNQNWIEFDSPIGRIRVLESGSKITGLEIAVSKSKKTAPAPSKVLLQAKAELEKYFAGKQSKFEIPVDYSQGTDFQKAVWKEIAKIPFGKTKSYVEIAKAIGRPKASRAVGGAVGANPIPLIVGCHRVLGASGTVTGYSGGKGIPTKLWLLKHENITAKDA